MLNIGASQPSGCYESSIEFTLPFDASVVVTDHNDDSSDPIRTSFPSRLGADAETPAACIAGVAVRSPGTVITSPTTSRTHITEKSIQPWRTFPTILPNVYVSAAAIHRIANVSMKLEIGVAFSNGCAEFTLKNPPPFVPSCLMAIWLATGPRAIVCANPWIPVTDADALRVCTMPWLIRMIATSAAIGSRT